jgi:hypothetical protein
MITLNAFFGKYHTPSKAIRKYRKALQMRFGDKFPGLQMIEDPVDVPHCLEHLHVSRAGDKAFARGEQGEVWNIRDDPGHVLKISFFNTGAAKDMWENEAQIGLRLGQLGVAPAIVEVAECEFSKAGLIVMERLSTIPKGPEGSRTHVRTKREDGEVVDYVRRLEDAKQQGFLDALRIAIENGYIHMDNHLDNIGYKASTGQPILFDFGFTQFRPRGMDINAAMAFSIGQLLEHSGDYEGTVWDRAFQTYLSAVPVPRIFMTKTGKAAAPATIVKQAAAFIREAPDNDLILGAHFYNVLLKLPIDARGVHKYMDIVYDIRMGKVKSPDRS